MNEESRKELAAQLRQYADDVEKYEKPWERWEFCSLNTGDWVACVCKPSFSHFHAYRRKPDTITVNGIEVPEPIRVEPEDASLGQERTMNELEQLKQEAQQLMKRIEQLEAKPAPRVLTKMPEHWQKYYYLTSQGDIISSNWAGLDADLNRWKRGSINISQEVAERADERQCAYAEIVRRIAQANNGWWPEDRVPKYYRILGKPPTESIWAYTTQIRCAPIELHCSEEAADKLGDSLDDLYRVWMGVE